MTCTIYLLKNTINNKIYIGQTWLPLKKRMGPSGNNYSNLVYLFSAITKYGSDNFIYEILTSCDSQEEADKAEIYYIDLYNSRDPSIGYNIKEGGSAGRHSEETNPKISESIKNKKWSEEALSNKRKAGLAWKGKKRGPQPKERTDKTSEFMKKRHAENGHPMQGKHHTQEAKAKISAAGKGRKKPEESVKRGAMKRRMDPAKEAAILEAYIKEIPINEIEKLCDTHHNAIYRVARRNGVFKKKEVKNWIGKKHSEETKAKMAESRRLYWQERKEEKK